MNGSEEKIPVQWRVGRKLQRTIYWQAGPEPSDEDVLVGMMDTPELASMVVSAVNIVASQTGHDGG